MVIGISSTGYVSVNVKIRALKAKLLALPDYDRIIQTDSLHEGIRTIIGLVMPSKLAEPLSLLISSADELGLLEIERALTQGFVAIQKNLGEMCPEITRKFLELYYLKKYEYDVLKTIIKSIHKGIAPEYIQELILLPISDEVEYLTGLAEIESIELLKDSVHDVFAKQAILESFEAYEMTESTLPIELSLDRVLYSQIWDSISKLAKGDRKWAYHIFGIRIDLLNILTILRGLHLGLDALKLRKFIIPVTYQLKKNLEQAMESKTILEAIRFLPVRPYVGLVNRIREIIEENRSLVEAEYLVEEYLTREDARVFIGYPFHVGTVLAFLNIFSVEIRNLKTILIGKFEGVPAEKIRKSLVLVQ